MRARPVSIFAACHPLKSRRQTKSRGRDRRAASRASRRRRPSKPTPEHPVSAKAAGSLFRVGEARRSRRATLLRRAVRRAGFRPCRRCASRAPRPPMGGESLTDSLTALLTKPEERSDRAKAILSRQPLMATHPIVAGTHADVRAASPRASGKKRRRASRSRSSPSTSRRATSRRPSPSSSKA